MKTDLYTKIVLTVIAVTLIGLLVKDVNLVGKAKANELDLSGLRIEEASILGRGDVSFFIYDNSKLNSPFKKWSEGSIRYSDTPAYVITTKMPD